MANAAESLRAVADVGFTILSEPKDAVLDIVFVHGLQGGPQSTWTYKSRSVQGLHEQAISMPSNDLKVIETPIHGRLRKIFKRKSTKSGTIGAVSGQTNIKEHVGSHEEEVFWPRDLLKDDLPKARIMTFGYDSHISRGYRGAHQGNIFSHARDLLFGLEAKRRSSNHRDLPIVFIAHSLGGILVKEALRRSEAHTDPSVTKIFTMTIGVFFFGTPHRGSREWASLGEGLAAIQSRLLGIDINSQVIHALLPNGPELELCRESFAVQWERRRSTLTVRTFQESRGIVGIRWGGLNQLIVPSDSSTLDHPDQRARTLDGDHRTMVQFSGPRDIGYEMVKGDLEALMEKAGDMEWMLNSEPIQNQDEHHCLQGLRTSDYEQLKDRNPERLDKTCEWFLHHANFQTWSESKSSALLWVTGDPGCGKSVLAKYLVDQRPGFEGTDLRTFCYFFFKDDNQAQNSATAALSAILHQLFSQRNSLIRHAMKDYKTEGEKLPHIFQKLWNIFLRASSDPKAGEIVCIIDGLDECAETGRHQLIDALSTWFNERLSKEDNSRLKLIVTSRPYFDIKRRFGDLIRNFPAIQLAGENEAEAISREIDTVIEWKVSKLALDLTLSPVEQAILRNELLSKANRTYLWVKLVLDILYRTIGPTSRRLKEIVRCLPPTVDAAYESILDRIDPIERPRARKLLSIVVAASRPLTLQELNVALTVDLHHKSYKDLANDLDAEERFQHTVRDACGLFVTIMDQKVFLIHQTAREFLVGNSTVLNGWKHTLNPSQSALIIATSCICVIMFEDFDDRSEDEATIDDVTVGGVLDFGLLKYASCYWVEHFRKAQKQTSSEISRLVLQVSDPRSRRFDIWSCQYRTNVPHISMPEFENSLMVASYFGHETIVKQLLNEKDCDVDLKDEVHGRTSLAWAAHRGHMYVVGLLLSTGKADIEAKDNGHRTPLSLACSTRQESVALLLLENGADPMYKATQARSALLESASQGLPKVVDWILQSASERTLETIFEEFDAEGKSILNLAVLSEHESQYLIVKMVLDALRPFAEKRRNFLYHQDDSKCSVLFHAALRDEVEVVKLLVSIEEGLLHQTGYYDWGDTPLHVATHWQNPRTIRALIRAGANADAQQCGGQTPLHIACGRPDNFDGVQTFNILFKHADNRATTHFDENIVHFILRSDGVTYFHAVVDHVPEPCLHQLLTSKNTDGYIPLLDATFRLGHADYDYGSRSRTFKAVCEATTKIVSGLDAQATIDLIREQDRRPSLYQFIETSSDELIGEIIPKLAAFDQLVLDRKDAHGQTPLMKAVERHQRRTVQLLIDNGAKIDNQDNLGKTALHYAVERDIPTIAELLVHAGASKVIKDNFARTPVDWCSSRNNCVAILNPEAAALGPIPIEGPASIRSSRSSWSITFGSAFGADLTSWPIILGGDAGFFEWNIQGETDWYSPTVAKSLREERYLISEPIPENARLPVSQVSVMIEGRDQGWSSDRWFSDRPEGSFQSDSTFALAILRNDELVLQREWARNRHRSKTPHRFECTWHSDSERNRQHVGFGGRRAVGSDDQSDFVRRLTVGDRVAILSLASGQGWMNIVKSAAIEIILED